MSRILGIDLGTTNSAMAIIVDGEARIIENAQGRRTTPSAVSFISEDDYVVGDDALGQALDNPFCTVTSIKRFMGRTYTETAAERENVTYRVQRGPNDCVRVKIKTRERSVDELLATLHEQVSEHGVDFYGGNLVLENIDGKKYSPEEISACVLRKMKADAELALGEEITDAVITVPAYFADSQRQATRIAGRLAGLNVLRVISEPTAAALAYGVGDPRRDETVMIFDLGGGTFDVSLLQIKEGVFRVLATSGDNRLGGDDWDMRLMVHLSNEFSKEHGFQLLEHDECLQRLKDAAVRMKCELSSVDEACADVGNIVVRDGVAYDLHCTVTRKQFENMTRLLRGRLDIPVNTALKDAGLTYKDLDRVVLVGGSTRIPSVRELVKRHTRLEPVEGVNPDEAVAMGAAIQAGLLTGEVAGIELHDVTPLSLGIEVYGGVMDVLIPRNTSIPASTEQVYETTTDNQDAVTVKVYQGERGIAVDNKCLGTFRLEGVPPMPAGKAHIEVSFDIDANGIVTVSARELVTGVEQSIHITGSTALSPEEVDAMIADAQAHNAEDDLYATQLDLSEEADRLLQDTDKALRRYRTRLSPQQLDAIQSTSAALHDCLYNPPAEPTAEHNDALKERLDALREAREPLEVASKVKNSKEIGWWGD